MVNRAEELITQFEAEIVKRDARIVEQAREIERIESERAEQWRIRRDAVSEIDTKSAIIAELRAGQALEIERIARAYTSELDDLAQRNYNMRFEIAALKDQQPSGVVLPDLIAELKKQADEIAREGHAGWGNTMLLAAEALSVAGVVLPHRRLYFQSDDIRADGHCEGWNACLDEVARLNPCRAQSVPDVLFDGFAVYSALDAKAQGRTSPENVSDTLDAAVRLIRAAAPSAQQKALNVIDAALQAKQ